MKIEHKKVAKSFREDLSPFQQKTFTVAIILAFLGIFVWFIKILFF